jgi:hypothetical protein
MSETYDVVYRPIRPDFSIEYLTGTSTPRGYHETFYRVVSARELDADDFDRLDDIGLLGMGQEYRVLESDTFADQVPAVTVDRLTGQPLPDVPPRNWKGDVITNTSVRTYYRYRVRRICDSGD